MSTNDNVIIWSCPGCDVCNVIAVHNEGKTVWQLRCQSCGVRGPSEDTRDGAVKAWNKLAKRVQLTRLCDGKSGGK